MGTLADVDRVLQELPGVIANLRSISPFWKDGKDEASNAHAAQDFKPTYA